MGGRDQWPFLRISWIASFFVPYLLSKGEIWFVKATHKRTEMIWQNKESTAMEYCYVFRRQWALHFHHGLISHSRLNWKCSVIPISLFWFLKGHNKYSLRVKWVICPGHRPLYIYIKLECTFTISWTIEISHLPSCLDVCTHQCLTIYMHNVFFFFFLS